MKHIESIQPEYAAGDLSRLLVSEPDATASDALTALLHNVTGCNIPPTSDTPQSEVEELVPLCLSILRRHWTTPLTALGDGTTPMSLADLMRRLIGDRVQGNEAWSIPAIHADIPTAVAALRQRHIDDGLTLTIPDGDGSPDGSPTTSPTTTSLPDGLSLAQVLCGTLASQVTEIVDSNEGWKCGVSSTYEKKVLTRLFPNLNRVVLSFNYINGILFYEDTIDEVIFNKATTVYSAFSNSTFKRIYLPLAEYIDGDRFLYKSSVEELYMPKVKTVGHTGSWSYMLMFDSSQAQKDKLTTLVYGPIEFVNVREKGWLVPSSANLIHLEFGQGTCASLDISLWNPTTALSERLPEFLSNFKTYIAHRLTDKGSGLTLTLSQAVRDAIQQDPEIVNIITSKGWTISPAPSV